MDDDNTPDQQADYSTKEQESTVVEQEEQDSEVSEDESIVSHELVGSQYVPPADQVSLYLESGDNLEDLEKSVAGMSLQESDDGRFCLVSDVISAILIVIIFYLLILTNPVFY